MHFSPFDYEQLWTPQQFIKVEIILKYLVVFRLGWSNARGVVVGEKARIVPFMLSLSQPRSPLWVSSQGRKSGTDRSQDLCSRRHMGSETLAPSLHFHLLFRLEGQRVDFVHSASRGCAAVVKQLYLQSAGQRSPRATVRSLEGMPLQVPCRASSASRFVPSWSWQRAASQGLVCCLERRAL